MQSSSPNTIESLLFPIPVQATAHNGVFRLHTTTSIASEPQFQEIGELAAGLLGCKQGGEDILFKYDANQKKEAYRLTIRTHQIVVKASTASGAFHGLSTLRRLDMLCNHLIVCATIDDEPAYRWRGFMLDTSRHYFTPTFLKKLIDVASLFHLNRFHWHLTDDQGWRIPIEGWERLETVGSKRKLLQYTDHRTYGKIYGKEEILDIQAYAHQRQMLVIPEIETPGHVSSVLAAYPELGCTKGPYEVQDRWGIFEDVLCAGNDQVLTFLQDVIGQVAALFSDPYIHIGGDECPHTAWGKCPLCKNRMKQEGLTEPRQLQSWLTSRICKMVNDAGKRPIGWDEVLEGTQNMDLPSSLIVMSWRGVEGGKEAARRGHEVIMSPNTEGCYLDYKHVDSPEEMGNLGVSTLRQAASFSPRLKDTESMVLGAQANLWTEQVTSSRQAEYLLFPRLMLLSQQLWNPQREEQNLSALPLLYRLCDKLDLHCYKERTE